MHAQPQIVCFLRDIIKESNENKKSARNCRLFFFEVKKYYAKLQH